MLQKQQPVAKIAPPEVSVKRFPRSVGQPILAAAGFQPAPGVSTFRYGFPDGPTARRPSRGSCLVSGHGFSRAVGGSQFRALAPAAFLLPRVRRYVFPMLHEALPTLHARLGEATLPDLSPMTAFLLQAV